MDILIVAINFRPESTGCAPYTTDLVDALISRGHRVAVVTGLPHYPEWKVKESHNIFFSREESGNLELMRLWHYVPNYPSTFKRGIYELTFFLHSYFRTSRMSPKIAIAVSPSLLSLLTVYLVGKNSGATTKALVQDLVSFGVAESQISRSRSVISVLMKLEGLLLGKMNSLAVVSDKFSHSVRQLVRQDININVLKNYILPKLLGPMERAGSKSEWGWSEKDFLVMYTGNIGAKQGLENVIEAARIIQNISPIVKFIIVGSGNQDLKLKKEALGLTNVQFMDLVEDGDYLRLLSVADVLLAHESPNLSTMSISSKITSYRASGRPILVVCSKSSATYEEVVEHNLNHCEPGDPTKLSEALISFSEIDLTSSIDKQKNSELRNSRVNWAISNEY